MYRVFVSDNPRLLDSLHKIIQLHVCFWQRKVFYVVIYFCNFPLFFHHSTYQLLQLRLAVCLKTLRRRHGFHDLSYKISRKNS